MTVTVAISLQLSGVESWKLAKNRNIKRNVAHSKAAPIEGGKLEGPDPGFGGLGQGHQVVGGGQKVGVAHFLGKRAEHQEQSGHPGILERPTPGSPGPWAGVG